MKNLVIFFLVIGLVVLGYITATANLKLRLESMEGKTEKVIRGDLTLPINATGEVRPAHRVEIKSEASGEVIEIAREPGDRVKAGELLIRLQPDEEQRSVKRANNDLASAKARLDTAKIRLELAKGADLANAQAQVDQLKPMVTYAKYRKDRIEEMDATITNPEEILQRQTEHARQSAQLEAAMATLEKAKLAVPLAEQSVIEAEAAYDAAKSNVADAEKRLRETDVTSPIDGVVADIRTQIGSVIQGGKTTLTGGTVLAVILDMDEILVQAEVDESDIGRILELAPAWAQPGRPSDETRPEDTALALAKVENPPRITVESFRDEEFVGIINTIKPEPQTLSGVVTYIVDILIVSENRDRLLSGMRADVTFTAEHVSNVVLCPNEAIKKGPTGKFGVYVPKPGTSRQDRKYEFVECEFGLDNGVYSEVRGGLDEGREVFTTLPAAERNDKKRRN